MTHNIAHRLRPALGALAVLVVAGCKAPDRAPAPAATATDLPRPTPAPGFADIDKASLDELLTYARSLEFNTDPGYGDRQALAVPTREKGICPEECQYGPVARIEPEIGSVSISDADLKAGRIISRMVNEGPGDYKKLNLSGRDTTYVWVFATDSGMRARFISTSKEKEAESRRNRSVQVDPEPHPGRFTRSMARWVWKTQDEGSWTTCGQQCCTSGDEP